VFRALTSPTRQCGLSAPKRARTIVLLSRFISCSVRDEGAPGATWRRHVGRLCHCSGAVRLPRASQVHRDSPARRASGSPAGLGCGRLALDDVSPSDQSTIGSVGILPRSQTGPATCPGCRALHSWSHHCEMYKRTRFGGLFWLTKLPQVLDIRRKRSGLTDALMDLLQTRRTLCSKRGVCDCSERAGATHHWTYELVLPFITGPNSSHDAIKPHELKLLNGSKIGRASVDGYSGQEQAKPALIVGSLPRPTPLQRPRLTMAACILPASSFRTVQPRLEGEFNNQLKRKAKVAAIPGGPSAKLRRMCWRSAHPFSTDAAL